MIFERTFGACQLKKMLQEGLYVVALAEMCEAKLLLIHAVMSAYKLNPEQEEVSYECCV